MPLILCTLYHVPTADYRTTMLELNPVSVVDPQLFPEFIKLVTYRHGSDLGWYVPYRVSMDPNPLCSHS